LVDCTAAQQHVELSLDLVRLAAVVKAVKEAERNRHICFDLWSMLPWWCSKEFCGKSGGHSEWAT